MGLCDLWQGDALRQYGVWPTRFGRKVAQRLLRHDIAAFQKRAIAASTGRFRRQPAKRGSASNWVSSEKETDELEVRILRVHHAAIQRHAFEMFKVDQRSPCEFK